jgi:hypothetical protein
MHKGGLVPLASKALIKKAHSMRIRTTKNVAGKRKPKSHSALASNVANVLERRSHRRRAMAAKAKARASRAAYLRMGPAAGLARLRWKEAVAGSKKLKKKVPRAASPKSVMSAASSQRTQSQLSYGSVSSTGSGASSSSRRSARIAARR